MPDTQNKRSKYTSSADAADRLYPSDLKMTCPDGAKCFPDKMPPTDRKSPGKPVKGRNYWQPLCDAASDAYGKTVGGKPCEKATRTVCEDSPARAECCAIRKDQCQGKVDPIDPDYGAKMQKCQTEFALCTGRAK